MSRHDYSGIASCCVFLLIFVAGIAMGIYFSPKKQHADSETKKDSIDWAIESKKIVIICESDSLFHYSTMCEILGRSPKITIEHVARLKGKWMCPICGIKETEYQIHKDEYLKDLKETDSI